MKHTNKWMLIPVLVLIFSLILSGCAPAVEIEAPVEEPAVETEIEEAAPTEEEVVEEEVEVVEEPVEEPVVLVDGFGREFTFTEPAQRIVSLAPSNVEIVFAIGAGEQLVGRDDFADFPEEALAVESIGSVYGDLNTEALVALEPDLVLGAGLTSPEKIQAVEDLGIPIFIVGNPADFEGLYANLAMVGTLTGHEAEAAALAESLQIRVAAVAEKVAGVEPVTVFYEVDASDPEAPWTVGAGTFHDYVITMVGGINIAAEVEFYATLSTEEIITADPEFIIFAAGPWVPTTVESVAERPGWSDISAVVNGQVYGIDTNWFDRPGPRLVDALEAMAEYLHPELFE